MILKTFIMWAILCYPMYECFSLFYSVRYFSCLTLIKFLNYLPKFDFYNIANVKNGQNSFLSKKTLSCIVVKTNTSQSRVFLLPKFDCLPETNILLLIHFVAFFDLKYQIQLLFLTDIIYSFIRKIFHFKWWTNFEFSPKKHSPYFTICIHWK